MEWRRLFWRKRWLINIPPILWQVIWGFTKDTIIEATRNYFAKPGILMGVLDYLLQHPIIIVGVVAIVIFVWAYADTRREKQSNLNIDVQKLVLLDWLPVNKYEALADTSMCTFEANVRFRPIGEIKIDKLELHLGRHSYDAENIPITILNQEGVYDIGFKVHNWIITPLFKGKTILAPYIRVVSGRRDWRSKGSGFSLGTE